MDNIFLKILTPEQVLWEGVVAKVELPGDMGRFMVLRNHAPVISSLSEGDVVFVSDGSEERIHIISGFASVNANVVTVCAEV